jgi:hypothetical protein
MLREADEGVSVDAHASAHSTAARWTRHDDLLLAESISDGPSPSSSLTRGSVHLAPWPDAAFHRAAQPWLYVEIHNLPWTKQPRISTFH